MSNLEVAVLSNVCYIFSLNLVGVFNFLVIFCLLYLAVFCLLSYGLLSSISCCLYLLSSVDIILVVLFLISYWSLPYILFIYRFSW